MRRIQRAGLVLGAVLVFSMLAWPVSPAWAPPLVFYSAPCTAAVAIPTTTETVACTVAGVTIFAGENVRLLGFTQMTTGTGTTSLTVRLRRGTSTAGTLVGAAVTIQTTAGNTVAVPIGGEDSPGELASGSYVLTVQQVAATANGSAVSSELLVWGL